VANEKDARNESEKRKKSYPMPESGFVEPLVKLFIRKSLLWEFLGLPKHIRFIPGLEPKEFLL
jgi:hypothetical protein